MKYLLIMTLFIFSSCAIQGEKFRLQTRMNNWNQILTPEQHQLFAQNDTNTLGMQLDEEESKNSEFAEKIRELRIDEAIMSFNGVQTAYFYYNTLLKDLVKFSYAEFMQSLNADDQILFMYSTNYSQNEFIKANKVLKNVSTYGMKDFSKDQVLHYYRTVSMPAVVYVLVYDILAFLAKYQLLEAFLAGDFEKTSSLFKFFNDAKTSTKISLRRQVTKDEEYWKSLKQRSLLKVSDIQFLEIIRNVILPEMDPDVKIQTIDNIRKLFKEQK